MIVNSKRHRGDLNKIFRTRWEGLGMVNGITASVQHLKFRDETLSGNDASHWTQIFQLLQEIGLWDKFQFHGDAALDHKDLPSLGSLPEAAQKAAKNDGISWQLSSHGDFRGLWCVFRLFGPYLHASLTFCDSIDSRDIEQGKRFVEALLLRFGGQIRTEASVYLDPKRVPRHRPPLRYQKLRVGSVMEWLDTSASPTVHSPPSQVREQLSQAELPAMAMRCQYDEAISFLQWGPFDDEKSLLETLACRLNWLQAQIETKPESGFHSYGDVPHSLNNLVVEHRPLGGYDTFTKVGYKKAVKKDGSLHEKRLLLIRGWMEAGELPDGTALEGLWMVASDRPRALLLHQRLKEVGATGVLWYEEATDTFWDIDPPGNWLSPIRR